MKIVKLFLYILMGGLGQSGGAVEPELRWGADMESGAPYAYRSPSDPSVTVGFEAEVVAALAEELGREPKFFQNNWEGLVEGLRRKDYDIAINGIEITPDRERVVRFSRPYYYTAQALAVRKDHATIMGLSDLKNKKVGTLGATLAERILRQQAFALEVVTYGEEVNLYGDLALGRIDAVLLDAPIALYYAAPNPQLKIVGPPIGEMRYGIITRLDDEELAIDVDQALGRLIASGKLRQILERWNLWNALTAQAWNLPVTPLDPPTAYEEYIKTAWTKPGLSARLQQYVGFLPLLAQGAWMTLKISILSMLLAMLTGILIALGRVYGNGVLSAGCLAFVEVFRGTPLLIQLFLIFYGLPHLGVRLDPFFAAVLGLGLNYGACEAENYRAGILAVARSQTDAALALGMNWRQTQRHVVLPQAFRLVIPPMTNDFIALLKDSSLVSVISMVELTTIYGQLASTHFDYLGIGLLTAAMYFLIGLPFVRLSRYLERRLNTSLQSVRR